MKSSFLLWNYPFKLQMVKVLEVEAAHAPQEAFAKCVVIEAGI